MRDAHDLTSVAHPGDDNAKVSLTVASDKGVDLVVTGAFGDSCES